jgi:ribosomal protein S10
MSTTPRTTAHTLLDVMNEELNKLGVSKPAKSANKVSEIASLASISTSPKGWNKINTPAATASPLMPLSQILEIEKNSKEQYKKIVNRNMDLIVLEEKAIQNLRKLYNADDNRDMRITIELIYDTDVALANYTPIWRK